MKSVHYFFCFVPKGNSRTSMIRRTSVNTAFERRIGIRNKKRKKKEKKRK